MTKACELCNRMGPLTKHHLLPKEEGGTEADIALICSDCHRQIHALYSNKELALRLTTIEALKQDEKILKFLNFIRKQPTTKRMTISKSNHIKKR